MKNTQYIVLKEIYRMSKKYGEFIKEDLILSSKCSPSFLTYLEFEGFLTYKREDKTTYYKLSPNGINQILKFQRDKWNFIFTLIAAIASVIGIILSVLSLLL